jgi:hypothetical protein
MWIALGIHEIINVVMLVDRSGSTVLKEILWSNTRLMPGFDDLGLKEVVAVIASYIWWVRRRRTHNDLGLKEVVAVIAWYHANIFPLCLRWKWLKL